MNEVGLFETMKLVNGKILLEDFHFDRLFKGLQLLQFELPGNFSAACFSNEIRSLSVEKGLSGTARIRLSVCRENNNTAYSIEAEALNPALLFEKDLKIDVYPFEFKPCDERSNLKSLPFVPYANAAAFAVSQKLDDCIVLNKSERIADSSISNIFVVIKERLYTPALSEGCVEGVIRKHLLKHFPGWGYDCLETEMEIDDLFEADEIFLTNAIRGIRSVKHFRDKTYQNKITEQIIAEYKLHEGF